MPRTKTGEFNQIAYQNEFNKRNYDRIEIFLHRFGNLFHVLAITEFIGYQVKDYFHLLVCGNGSRAERKRIYKPGH